MKGYDLPEGQSVPKTITGVPVNEFPVKEFVDVVVFLVKTGNTIYDVTQENSPGGSKIALTEYPQFIPLFFSLKDALAGITDVPDELSDHITDEEKEQIAEELLKLKYVSTDEQAQELIQDTINWIAATHRLVKKYVF